MIRFAFGAVLRAGDALEGGRIERREQRFRQAGVRVDKGRLYGGACVESAGQRGRVRLQMSATANAYGVRITFRASEVQTKKKPS